MKFNKKIIIILCFILIIPTILIGCGEEKKVINENISENENTSENKNISENENTSKIILEKQYGKCLKISMCYDKEKATSEKLKKVVDDISKDKDRLGENKSIEIMFYEKENEAYYSDLIPYAIGFWGSEKGSDYSQTQISTKNNKSYVEFSSEKDMNISDEETKIYENLLEHFKPTNNSTEGFMQSIIFALLKAEPLDFSKEEIQNVVEKVSSRYQSNAIDKIKNGPLG